MSGGWRRTDPASTDLPSQIGDQIATIDLGRVPPGGDERDKDIANAIRYAADNGAHVINMSFGKGYSPGKPAVDSAVRYAAQQVTYRLLRNLGRLAERRGWSAEDPGVERRRGPASIKTAAWNRGPSETSPSRARGSIAAR